MLGQVLSHNLYTVLCIPHDPVALEEHFRDDDDGPVSSQGYMPYLNKYILDKVSPRPPSPGPSVTTVPAPLPHLVAIPRLLSPPLPVCRARCAGTGGRRIQSTQMKAKMSLVGEARASLPLSIWPLDEAQLRQHFLKGSEGVLAASPSPFFLSTPVEI